MFMKNNNNKVIKLVKVIMIKVINKLNKGNPQCKILPRICIDNKVIFKMLLIQMLNCL